jgi:hypothetical protein
VSSSERASSCSWHCLTCWPSKVCASVATAGNRPHTAIGGSHSCAHVLRYCTTALHCSSSSDAMFLLRLFVELPRYHSPLTFAYTRWSSPHCSLSLLCAACNSWKHGELQERSNKAAGATSGSDGMAAGCCSKGRNRCKTGESLSLVPLHKPACVRAPQS